MKGRAIIRSNTATNRFIKSSDQDIAALLMASGTPRLYPFAISVGLTTYHRERLTRIAELAYSQRNVKALEQAAREALASHEFHVRVHTAEQRKPGKVLRLDSACARRRQLSRPEAWLPGME